MADSTEPRHPIRVVAQRTGLSTPVLRAWERRYGAVAPTRSEGGQRLYSDDDVRRLQLLATAVDGGRSIGLIADLSAAELEALIDEDRETPVLSPAGTVAPNSELVEEGLDLIRELRVHDLEQFLMRQAVVLRPEELVEGLMTPLLQEIGRSWQSGRLPPSSEHLASVAIRRFLEWVADTNTSGASAPLAVTGTPAGQRHEFGALLAGVIAGYEGWRVRFLGPDLPASEIARVAQQLGASLVALSAVHPRLDAGGVQDVLELRQLLPANVRLVIGGAGADPHRERWKESGVQSFGTLADFRQSLGISRDAN